MFCSRCGSRIPENGCFCPKCGNSVNTVHKTGTRPEEKKMAPPMKNGREQKESRRKGKGSKIRIILMLLLLLSVLAAAIIVEEKLVAGNRYEHQISLGEKYLEELDYEAAEAAFRAAAKIDPKQPDAYLGLAKVYVETENFDMAIQVLQEGYTATQDPLLEQQVQEVEKVISREKSADDGIVELSDPFAGELAEAMQAYKEFLENRENFRSMLETPMGDGMAVENGMIGGFFLKDFDGDQVPELLIEMELPYSGDMYVQSVYIYSYDDIAKKVEQCSVIQSRGNFGRQVTGKSEGYWEKELENKITERCPDYASAWLAHYEGAMTVGCNDQNHVVSFQNEGDIDLWYAVKWGSYSEDQGFIMMYPEDWKNSGGNFFMEYVGDSDYMDDIDLDYYEEIGRKEQAKKEMSGYIPFRFYEISQDNIDQYLTVDYADTDIYSYTEKDVWADSEKRYERYYNIDTGNLNADGTVEGGGSYNLEYMVQFSFHVDVSADEQKSIQEKPGDLEAEIQRIRTIYYGIRNNPDNITEGADPQDVDETGEFCQMGQMEIAWAYGG